MRVLIVAAAVTALASAAHAGDWRSPPKPGRVTCQAIGCTHWGGGPQHWKPGHPGNWAPSHPGNWQPHHPSNWGPQHPGNRQPWGGSMWSPRPFNGFGATASASAFASSSASAGVSVRGSAGGPGWHGGWARPCGGRC